MKVIFDVDGTICNGRPAGPECLPRPGIRFAFGMTKACGAELHLWSAAGREHARAVAHCLHLDDLVTGYWDKASGIGLLGTDLVFVDDTPEAVLMVLPNVEVIGVPSWWGDGEHRELEEKLEAGKEALREAYSANAGDAHLEGLQGTCTGCGQPPELCWASLAREAMNL